ncbi:conserved hypothetical protein [Hyella patelloides LEGE 07179]|uniref:Uncharacterized protein n=1 Tax=Hyella patelloides LEGE 07179 TaxID=945734 RepID=A0A563VWF8_9CYAN|nr:hypothetical protein [Hyella patelloides]VEP15789.1 conserved hypothetical protein [Hyella patelloides LEGE 07179]
MKISKSYINFDNEYPSSIMEITDKQLTKTFCKCSISSGCAQNILPLESQLHRNYGKVNHGYSDIPKRCHIAGKTYSEKAFSILQYQLKDRQARQTHLSNLKRNLERRIQAAKAQRNSYLVDLLTQESREIASLEC